MNPKAELAFIFTIAFVLPIACFFMFSSYFDQKYALSATQFATYIQKEKTAEPISLLFVGDIMLDRTIRKDGEAQGYAELFSCLPDMFAGYDEVIGNLEGTVTNYASVSRDAGYQEPASFRFTFDIAAVKALVNAGLSIVSIGNNHIRDYGDAGIAQTVANLDTLEVPYFGDPRPGVKRYTVEDVKGTRIAFIAYNEFFGTPEQTLSDLAAASLESDMQVIFPHWGDEYVPPRASVKELARSFVDGGADLIIGAHPHVIQESETYKEVPIYYSLGNFIFDQYWEPAVSTGMMVNVTITDGKITDRKEILVESKRHAGTCLKQL